MLVYILYPPLVRVGHGTDRFPLMILPLLHFNIMKTVLSQFMTNHMSVLEGLPL